MAVGIKLGNITDEIGDSDFLHAFFSTISGNLEPNGWGTIFPKIMKNLYAGEIEQSDAEFALLELNEINEKLSNLSLKKLIWDIENPQKVPPWGDDIADTITNLSNYFVTSTGRNLIEVLREVFEELRVAGGVARVISY